jgi:hypothetical protein
MGLVCVLHLVSSSSACANSILSSSAHSSSTVLPERDIFRCTDRNMSTKKADARRFSLGRRSSAGHDGAVSSTSSSSIAGNGSTPVDVVCSFSIVTNGRYTRALYSGVDCRPEWHYELRMGVESLNTKWRSNYNVTRDRIHSAKWTYERL